VKELGAGNMLVMCDDCESQWSSPAEAQSYENALKQEVKVELASSEDVKRAGWERYQGALRELTATGSMRA
jgi:hypothetical protein